MAEPAKIRSLSKHWNSAVQIMMGATALYYVWASTVGVVSLQYFRGVAILYSFVVPLLLYKGWQRARAGAPRAGHGYGPVRYRADSLRSIRRLSSLHRRPPRLLDAARHRVCLPHFGWHLRHHGRSPGRVYYSLRRLRGVFGTGRGGEIFRRHFPGKPRADCRRGRSGFGGFPAAHVAH